MKTSSRELLSKVDAVVFDCDGVLIDARRSYDATIRVVVEKMVKEVSGVRLPLAEQSPRLISTMRRTGGFNSDWDTTYGLTLFSLVALATTRDGRRETPAGRIPRVTEALMRMTAAFGSAPRGRGKEAVDSFLRVEFQSMQDDLDKWRDYLGYPETPPEGRLTTVFDELYFGTALYEKVRGVPARNSPARGLIELERVLVDRETMEALAKILGGQRFAMVTGRPRLGTEYSLRKRMMNYFDKDSSVFIGDADVRPNIQAEYEKYRKPSPDALIRAKEKLASETILYVGDSAEDLMMVQNARLRGLEGYHFAGIYGTSPVFADQVSFFEREGSDVIAESVNLVPTGLSQPSPAATTRRRGRRGLDS